VPIARLTVRAGLALGAFALALGHATPSAAFSPFLVVPDAATVEASPAYRYANMTDAEAFDALDHRGIPYTKVDVAPGVRAPIRLAGRLHGVWFHSSLPAEERVASPFEILDARLALALDDFAAILEAHDVDEVVHYTMYRPDVGGAEHGVADEPVASPSPAVRRRATTATSSAPSRPVVATRAATHEATAKPAATPTRAKATPAKAAADKATAPAAKPRSPGEADRGARLATTPTRPAAHPSAAGTSSPSHDAARVAHRGATALAPSHRTTHAPPGTRHPAGLAIDVGLVHDRKTNRWLSVASHFHGRIGERTCGDHARSPDDVDDGSLRALVCEVTSARVFTYVLTPNYNAAHADHFHMEIKPGVRWFLTH
jgi:hypothetical protein